VIVHAHADGFRRHDFACYRARHDRLIDALAQPRAMIVIVQLLGRGALALAPGRARHDNR